jgi:hypothetical protein
VKSPSHPSFPQIHSLAGRSGLRGRLRIFGGQNIECDSPSLGFPKRRSKFASPLSDIARIDLMLDGTGGKLRHSGKPRNSTA